MVRHGEADSENPSGRRVRPIVASGSTIDAQQKLHSRRDFPTGWLHTVGFRAQYARAREQVAVAYAQQADLSGRA